MAQWSESKIILLTRVGTAEEGGAFVPQRDVVFAGLCTGRRIGRAEGTDAENADELSFEARGIAGLAVYGG
jgi:hypothetical protein